MSNYDVLAQRVSDLTTLMLDWKTKSKQIIDLADSPGIESGMVIAAYSPSLGKAVKHPIPNIDTGLYQLRSEKNIINGYAGLDENALVQLELIPTLPISRITGLQDVLDRDIVSMAITGDSNKTLTLTKYDGSTITENFSDIDPDGDVFLNSLNFNSSNGTFTAVLNDAASSSVNLDGRYSLLAHSHSWDAITSKPTNLLYTNTTQTITGQKTFAINPILTNNTEIRWLDSGAAERTILTLDSSNDLKIGGSFAGSVNFIGGGAYITRGKITSSGNWEFYSDASFGGASNTRDFNISGLTSFQSGTTEKLYIYPTSTGVDMNLTGDAGNIRFDNRTGGTNSIGNPTSFEGLLTAKGGVLSQIDQIETLGLYRPNSSTASIQGVYFSSNNSASEKTNYASILQGISSNTDGSEEGFLDLYVINNGVLTSQFKLTSSEATFKGNTTTVGSSTFGGSVYGLGNIDWGNGVGRLTYTSDDAIVRATDILYLQTAGGSFAARFDSSQNTKLYGALTVDEILYVTGASILGGTTSAPQIVLGNTAANQVESGHLDFLEQRENTTFGVGGYGFRHTLDGNTNTYHFQSGNGPTVNTLYSVGRDTGNFFFNRGLTATDISAVNGADITKLTYSGIIFNRSSSYIQPTVHNAKTLYFGAATPGQLDWNAIRFNSANGVTINGNEIATQAWVSNNFSELAGDNVAYTNAQNIFTVPQSIVHSSNSTYALTVQNGGGIGKGLAILAGNTGNDASILKVANSSDTETFFEVKDQDVYVSNNLNIGGQTGSRPLNVFKDSDGSVATFLSYTDGSNFQGLYIEVSQATKVVTFNSSGTGGGGYVWESGNTPILSLSTGGDLGIGTTSSAVINMKRAGANYISASNAAGSIYFRTGGSTNRVGIMADGNMWINSQGAMTPQGNLHIVGKSGEQGTLYISDYDNGSSASTSLLITHSGLHSYIYNRNATGNMNFGTADDADIVQIKPDKILYANFGLSVTGEASFSNGTYGLKATYSVGNTSGILDTYGNHDIEFRRNNVQWLTVNSSLTSTFGGALTINDTLDNSAGTLTLNGRNTGQILFQSGGATKLTMETSGHLTSVHGATFGGVVNINGGTGDGLIVQAGNSVNDDILNVKLNSGVEVFKVLGDTTSIFKGNVNITGSSSFPLSITASVAGQGRTIRFRDVESGSTKYNWLIGTQYNLDNTFEITRSTTIGGDTYSTPSLRIDGGGNVTATNFIGNWNGYTTASGASANTVVLRDGNGYVKANYFYFENFGNDTANNLIQGFAVRRAGDKHIYGTSISEVVTALGTNGVRTTSNFVAGTDYLTTATLSSYAKHNTVQAYTKQQYATWANLTDSSDVFSWNCDDQQMGYIGVSGNMTFNNPTNVKNGAIYYLKIHHNTTGSKTITWGSDFDGGSLGLPSSISESIEDITYMTFVGGSFNRMHYLGSLGGYYGDLLL